MRFSALHAWMALLHVEAVESPVEGNGGHPVAHTSLSIAVYAYVKSINRGAIKDSGATSPDPNSSHCG